MKKRRGGVLSPQQRQWIDSVADLPAWIIIVAEGARDAIEQLRGLGYKLDNVE
jgi:hypothetical protein